MEKPRRWFVADKSCGVAYKKSLCVAPRVGTKKSLILSESYESRRWKHWEVKARKVGERRCQDAGEVSCAENVDQ